MRCIEKFARQGAVLMLLLMTGITGCASDGENNRDPYIPPLSSGQGAVNPQTVTITRQEAASSEYLGCQRDCQIEEFHAQQNCCRLAGGSTKFNRGSCYAPNHRRYNQCLDQTRRNEKECVRACAIYKEDEVSESTNELEEKLIEGASDEP